MDTTLEGEALRLANDVRCELGLSPRPHLVGGMRDIPDHCPISRTIRDGQKGLCVEVDAGQISIWVGSLEPVGDPDHSYVLGAAAADFTARFDRGEFPELVEEPGR